MLQSMITLKTSTMQNNNTLEGAQGKEWQDIDQLLGNAIGWEKWTHTMLYKEKEALRKAMEQYAASQRPSFKIEFHTIPDERLPEDEKMFAHLTGLLKHFAVSGRDKAHCIYEMLISLMVMIAHDSELSTEDLPKIKLDESAASQAGYSLEQVKEIAEAFHNHLHETGAAHDEQEYFDGWADNEGKSLLADPIPSTTNTQNKNNG